MKLIFNPEAPHLCDIKSSMTDRDFEMFCRDLGMGEDLRYGAIVELDCGHQWTYGGRRPAYQYPPDAARFAHRWSRVAPSPPKS